mgnify:CR=1 FL=1
MDNAGSSIEELVGVEHHPVALGIRDTDPVLLPQNRGKVA